MSDPSHTERKPVSINPESTMTLIIVATVDECNAIAELVDSEATLDPVVMHGTPWVQFTSNEGCGSFLGDTTEHSIPGRRRPVRERRPVEVTPNRPLAEGWVLNAEFGIFAGPPRNVSTGENALKR